MQGGNGLGIKIRPADDERIVTELFTASASAGRLMNRDLFNPCFRNRADAFGWNAVVPHGMVAVVHVKIIDDGRLLENNGRLIAMNAKTIGMRIAKIPRRHEREKIHTDAEIETRPDSRAIENDTRAFAKDRARRQRRPAAEIRRLTPANP